MDLLRHQRYRDFVLRREESYALACQRVQGRHLPACPALGPSERINLTHQESNCALAGLILTGEFSRGEQIRINNRESEGGADDREP